jgi:hypothetical protein
VVGEVKGVDSRAASGERGRAHTRYNMMIGTFMSVEYIRFFDVALDFLIAGGLYSDRANQHRPGE